MIYVVEGRGQGWAVTIAVTGDSNLKGWPPLNPVGDVFPGWADVLLLSARKGGGRQYGSCRHFFS